MTCRSKRFSTTSPGLANGTDAVALHFSPDQAAAIAWALLGG
jgi:hypothetical protein